METEIIFIYCLADAITRAVDLENEPRAKMTNAEIITFVMISALFYQCNWKFTRLVSQNCKWFSFLLSQSRINRRIHQIPHSAWLMIFFICREFYSDSREFIVDSFPLACCQNYKRFHCKLFPGKQFHGYTASKKKYFFGIKVHMIVNAQGIPIEFVFTPGSEADIRGLHRLSLDLPAGSILFKDKAYTEHALEDFLGKELNIQLLSQGRQMPKESILPMKI